MMPRKLQIEALESAPGDFRRILRPLPPEAFGGASNGDTINDVLESLIAREIDLLGRLTEITAEYFDYRPPELNLPAFERWLVLRAALCSWLHGLRSGVWNKQSIPGATLRGELQRLIMGDTDALVRLMHLRQAWDERTQIT
jgi:hypothetical protein